VRNSGVRPSDDVIVQTIIGMGRNLDLDSRRRGDEAQKALLIAHGCDLYQGHSAGAPPMPVADFEHMPTAAPPERRLRRQRLKRRRFHPRSAQRQGTWVGTRCLAQEGCRHQQQTAV
jgi:hypothetical protein